MNLGVGTGNLGFEMSQPQLGLGKPTLMEPSSQADLCCQVALDAERLGFHSVWAGDHLTLPLAPGTLYPGAGGGLLNPEVSILDPFAIHARDCPYHQKGRSRFLHRRAPVQRPNRHGKACGHHRRHVQWPRHPRHWRRMAT